MTLLRKYYSPGIEGGGIPDEVKKKIEPCPFCGKEANIIKRGNTWSNKRSAEIKCSGCGAFMIVGAIRNSLEWCESSVIDDWNKRTPLASEELNTYKRAINSLSESIKTITEKLEEKNKELARLKEDNERLRGGGWISVEDRLPTLADCFSEKYAEVLTIQVGRERPTMMKYYELKHCPFTKFWMRVPQQNKPLYLTPSPTKK